VEGESEYQIFNSVRKSSKSKFRYFAIDCNGKGGVGNVESTVSLITTALGEINEPIISLVDNDSHIDPLLNPDIHGRVKRFTTICYEIENCILSDDILKIFNLTWAKMKNKIKQYIANNILEAAKLSILEELINNPDARKRKKIKEVREDLARIIKPQVSWDKIISKGLISIKNTKEVKNPNSIKNYIGIEFLNEIF